MYSGAHKHADTVTYGVAFTNAHGDADCYSIAQPNRIADAVPDIHTDRHANARAGQPDAHAYSNGSSDADAKRRWGLLNTDEDANRDADTPADVAGHANANADVNTRRPAAHGRDSAADAHAGHPALAPEIDRAARPALGLS